MMEFPLKEDAPLLFFLFFRGGRDERGKGGMSIAQFSAEDWFLREEKWGEFTFGSDCPTKP